MQRVSLISMLVAFACVAPAAAASRPAKPRVLGPPIRQSGSGRRPYNVAYGSGSLWVAVSGGLVRLAPSGSVEARIDLGGRPWGLVIADGAVWVGNQFTQTVDVVDPRTNALERRFPLPGAPVGVALGGGSL